MSEYHYDGETPDSLWDALNADAEDKHQPTWQTQVKNSREKGAKLLEQHAKGEIELGYFDYIGALKMAGEPTDSAYGKVRELFGDTATKRFRNDYKQLK